MIRYGIYTFVYTYVCVYVYVERDLLHVCVYVHTLLHMYIYIYIYIYTHRHIFGKTSGKDTGWLLSLLVSRPLRTCVCLVLFECALKQKMHLAYTKCSFVINKCFASGKHHFSKHASRVGGTHISTCHFSQLNKCFVGTFWYLSPRAGETTICLNAQQLLL